MSNGTEFEITYQINRVDPDTGDPEEIGFGTTGSWDTTDQCVHWLASAVQNYDWETEAGQPDPRTIKEEIENNA